jgi:hypothetical protein
MSRVTCHASLCVRHKLENTRLEGRVQASQEERNHLRKQLERMQEKQQADANLKVRRDVLVQAAAAAAWCFATCPLVA